MQSLLASSISQIDVSVSCIALGLLLNTSRTALKANLACKIIGLYVVLTFVVMEILYFGVWCRPFREFWKTPTAKSSSPALSPKELKLLTVLTVQCATQTHHLLTNLVFNLSSDLLILSIPLPLLLRSSLSLNRKIILIFVFSLAFFVMLSAILSKVASFREPFSSIWVHWYTRESSMAVIVTNMPHCWALVRRVFKVKSFISNGITSNRRRRNKGTETMRFATLSKKGRIMVTNSTGDSVSTQREQGSPGKVPSIQRPVLNSLKSTFSIKDQSPAPSFDRPHGPALHIWEEKEFIVREESSENPRKAVLQPPFNISDLPGGAQMRNESFSSSSSARMLLRDYSNFLTSAVQLTASETGSPTKSEDGITTEDGIARMDTLSGTPFIPGAPTPLQQAVLTPTRTNDVPRISISAPPPESTAALSLSASASSSSHHPSPSRSITLKWSRDAGGHRTKDSEG